jgi:hypothetical protein
MLRTPREVRAALRYVLLNARHHAAGARHRAGTRPRRVETPGLDPASSARWFDGWRRREAEERGGEADPPAARPVARARTWLLSVGWRRHGLLDPDDVPG